MIRVYPYVRGYAPRHALHALWGLMEEDRATRAVFNEDPGTEGVPTDTRGDLVSFVTYFSSSDRVTLVCEDDETNEIMGLVWYDKIQPHWSAFANVWHRKKFRGAKAFTASRLCLEHAFQHFGWQKLWAITPWRAAARHAQIVGFLPVVDLPGFILLDGKPATSYLLSMTKDQFYRKDLASPPEGEAVAA